MPVGASRLLGYWLAPFFPMIRPNPLHLAAAAVLFFAAGCQRERIRVYVVAKDAPPAHHADDGHDHTGTAKHGATGEKPVEPQIAWQLPEGWRETETSSVNFANFAVPSATGGEATASIAQLPNLQGREPFVVNMWREQVGLGPVPEDEAAKAWYARVKSRPSFRPLLSEWLAGVPASRTYVDLDF